VDTVIANIGTWMYNAASGWLMTSLNPDPLAVSLVQAATTLPMFLFAVPAGALADIFDKRRFLIAVEVTATAMTPFPKDAGPDPLSRHAVPGDTSPAWRWPGISFACSQPQGGSA
jgi:hypothetical protein